MDEVLAAIQAAIAANGGAIDWQTFMAQLPERERARAYNHIKNWESQGLLRRQVVSEDGVPVFSVVIPAGEGTS